MCSQGQVLLFIASIASTSFAQLFLDKLPSNYQGRTSFQDCSKERAVYYYPAAVGGEQAEPTEFQHMVAIGWTRNDGAIAYLCGGSLLTRKFVLTAAHCAFDSTSVPPDTVRLGDIDLGNTEDDDGAQQVNIKRFIKHPEYRSTRSYSDIALIELETNVFLTPTVCPACIWREYEVPRDEMSAVGFGALGFGEALSPTLQKVQLSSIHTDKCSEYFSDSNRKLPRGLRSDQFCAGSNTMDTCEGDSGGPIQVERVDVGGNVIPLVVGVVSFGTPCSKEGSSGVYTRVSTYASWIEQEIGQSLNYTVCTKTTSCPGRKKSSDQLHYDSNFPPSRLVLHWNAENEQKHQQHRCVGTLVNTQHILTSASCATGPRGPPIYASVHDDGERVPIVESIEHPKYRKGRPEYDIALLKLGKFANMNEFDTVCLWNVQTDGKWDSSLHFPAYGPGYSDVDLYDDTNKFMLLRGNDDIQCKSATELPASGLICVNNDAPMVPDVCKIDYGGPVLRKPGQSNFVLGIVSQLTKDCSSDLYMTDISNHIDWIKSIAIDYRNEHLIFSS